MMNRLKGILGLAAVVLVFFVAWQMGAATVANMSLREDMRGIATQAGTRVGLLAPTSEEGVIHSTVLKAKEHGIDLQPSQVTVRRMQAGEIAGFYIAADYRAPISLIVFSFDLHFAPSTEE